MERVFDPMGLPEDLELDSVGRHALRSGRRRCAGIMIGFSKNITQRRILT